ncbi:MAG: LLM class F420-dependent oxidoreductase [Tepidiformaceae bacterium]
MKIGLSMFPADYALPVTELGKAAEDLGYESLFFPEHTHIPSSRRTPWPGGAPLPLEYSHTLDPFVAMAAVAAVTTTLLVGTGICLVIERDPITLAKEVASVDFLSGGRLMFGIGGGWNAEEMENHGTRYPVRWKIMRERVLAMKEIWTNDEAEYHGKYVDFDPIWSWPKPARKPHPPVLVGGDGPGTLARVVEYGDEWMPIGGRGGHHLTERIAELQTLAAAAGRGRIPVSVFGAPPDKATLEHLAEIGVDRAVFAVRPGTAAEVLPAIKHYAESVGL